MSRINGFIYNSFNIYNNNIFNSKFNSNFTQKSSNQSNHKAVSSEETRELKKMLTDISKENSGNKLQGYSQNSVLKTLKTYSKWAMLRN